MAGEPSVCRKSQGISAYRDNAGAKRDRCATSLKRIGQRNLVFQRLDSALRLGLIQVRGELARLVGVLAEFPEFERLGARHLASEPLPNRYHFLLSFSYP
jgi:hypothetical protein